MGLIREKEKEEDRLKIRERSERKREYFEYLSEGWKDFEFPSTDVA